MAAAIGNAIAKLSGPNANSHAHSFRPRICLQMRDRDQLQLLMWIVCLFCFFLSGKRNENNHLDFISAIVFFFFDSCGQSEPWIREERGSVDLQGNPMQWKFPAGFNYLFVCAHQNHQCCVVLCCVTPREFKAINSPSGEQ